MLSARRKKFILTSKIFVQPQRSIPIEGGDHSFKAPKKFGLPQEQIYEDAMNEIDRWSRSI